MTKLPILAQDTEIPGPPTRDAVIRNATISTLGRPPGLFRVAVLPLWQGRYRVNVLIGPDATSVCIPHSYFVVAGDDGSIISSSPPIIRLYR